MLKEHSEYALPLVQNCPVHATAPMSVANRHPLSNVNTLTLAVLCREQELNDIGAVLLNSSKKAVADFGLSCAYYARKRAGAGLFRALGIHTSLSPIGCHPACSH
ncbi:MAG: hypothetical protein ACPIOQ_41835, partial [Promethearchaeia archaeon]